MMRCTSPAGLIADVSGMRLDAMWIMDSGVFVI